MPSQVDIKSKGNPSNVLFWFKSDLRLEDSRGLEAALNQVKKYRDEGIESNLLCVYIINIPEFKDHDMAPIKFHFIVRHLEHLHQQLGKLNVPFIIEKLEDASEKIQDKLLSICIQYDIKSVVYNIEYEFNENKRDKQVTKLLKSKEIQVQGFHDQCILKPGSVKDKRKEEPFKMYTPFKNEYIRIILQDPKYTRISQSIPPTQDASLKTKYGNLFEWKLTLDYEKYEYTLNQSLQSSLDLDFPVGNHQAHLKFDSFVKQVLYKYKDLRDTPSLEGTSKISPYLVVGSISLRSCLVQVQSLNDGYLKDNNPHLSHFISELIWRDFFRHILYNFIHVSKSLPFDLTTQNFPWSRDETKFLAWTQGRTGFPIVDAGIRQLRTTGWMHNRLRQIVASFLTKDLLINWQNGEQFFMVNLIDGDLASNNGGWQYVASTGTDPRPNRIFNPLLQSKKYDPSGAFIAKFVPELKGLVNSEKIHEPYKLLSRNEFEKLGYPKPIVNHSKAKNLAIATYSKALTRKKI